MGYINSNYTKYFNNKYNVVGHLFQGRYRAELIESDAYNLQTSRYIHLNPVKASMVDVPLEYKWSSYGVYMGQAKSEIVTDEKLLSYFKDNSRQLYKNYVESKLINQEIDREIAKAMEVE